MTEKLNAAMRYIEKHLFDEIDFTEIEKRACCPEQQFRRMFSYLAGMPLQEYIRKRRLSLAVAQLRSGGAKIIDVAMQCGYKSPDAFGKAFQVMFGVSPSAFRKNPAALKAFPPLFFNLTLKGGIEMEYRIVERDAFYLMGKTGRIPLIYHGANPRAADVWNNLKHADLLVLTEYTESEPKGVLCVYEQTTKGTTQTKGEGDEILMHVGIVMEKPMPDRFKGRFDILPYEASIWLVFSAMDNTRDSTLPGTQALFAMIAEWLPTSEYEETGAPLISWCETYDFSKPDKKSEIWVPVRKRNV